MKYKLTKTSDSWGTKPMNREINTLEDIEKLEKEFDCDLIVSVKNQTIEIYDDYRE